MELLINRTDIAEYRQIAKSVDEAILNQQIETAQFMDLQPLLGADFYNDLLQKYRTDADYITLLKGGTYTYESVTYTNYGLKRVLCYYAAARYFRFGANVDTPFSLVTKTLENSEPVSVAEKNIIYKENQQVAYKYFMNVKQFLDRNAATYPLWEPDCITPSRTFRINKIV